MSGDQLTMNSRYRRIWKSVAVFTLVCLLHIAIASSAPFSVRAAEPGSPAPQNGGTFKSTNNQPIIVNGNSVKPGTTILSGADIETPAGIGATFQLGPVSVDVSPGSTLLLEFTATEVKVTLKSGCVTLRTSGNASGTIVLPNGSTLTTGNQKEISSCQGNPNPGAAAGTSAGTTSSRNIALIALLIGGAGVGIAIAVLGDRGANPSPGTP